jgi:hypothetical protein
VTNLKAAIMAWYAKYLAGVMPSKVLPPIIAQMLVAVPTLYEAHFPAWLFWSLSVAFLAFSMWAALVYPKTDLQMSSDLKGKMAGVMTVANEVIGNVAGADAAAMAAKVEGVMTPLVDKVLTTEATTETHVTASVDPAAPSVVTGESATQPFAPVVVEAGSAPKVVAVDPAHSILAAAIAGEPVKVVPEAAKPVGWTVPTIKTH